LAVFDDCVKSSFAKFGDATDANRYHATCWLAKIDSRGGTEMAMALRESPAFFKSPQATYLRDASLVLVTDGQITGEYCNLLRCPPDGNQHVCRQIIYIRFQSIRRRWNGQSPSTCRIVLWS